MVRHSYSFRVDRTFGLRVRFDIRRERALAPLGDRGSEVRDLCAFCRWRGRHAVALRGFLLPFLGKSSKLALPAGWALPLDERWQHDRQSDRALRALAPQGLWA